MSEEPQWTAWKAYLDSLFKSGGAGYETVKELGVDPSERTVRRLFWRDDMENYTTMKWLPWGGNEVLTYVDTPRAFEGDHCLEVRDPTGAYPLACAPFGPLSLGVHSLEVRWLSNWFDAGGPVIDAPHFAMANADPLAHDTIYEALIRYYWLRQVWQFSPSAGTWVDINGGGEGIYGSYVINDDRAWNYLKLTVDWENHVYKRLETNGLDLDLTSQNLPLRIPTLNVRAIGKFLVLIGGEVAAVNDPLYFDDVRIYLNEV